jgi:hypothetical protein
MVSVFTCSGCRPRRHREPAALAIADEIHPPTEELHRLLQHGDVPLDRPISGLIRRR